MVVGGVSRPRGCSRVKKIDNLCQLEMKLSIQEAVLGVNSSLLLATLLHSVESIPFFASA